MESMHSPNSYGTDDFFNMDYTPGRGSFQREPLPLLSGVWNDNGTLKAWAASTTGTVGFALLTTTQVGMRWEATADQTDRWQYPWQVPPTYRRDTGANTARSSLVVRVKARKVDISGSATDNTDLALTLQAYFHSGAMSNDGVQTAGDTSVAPLGAAISNTLNALAASDDLDADPENYRIYTFDVGAAMTDAQRAALKADASLTFSLAPNEAPGTGIAIDVLWADVIFTGHEQPANTYVKSQGLG